MSCKKIIKFGTKSLSCGLGDTLLLTAVCKNLNFTPTIQLRPQNKNFSILFDKLANIEITSQVHELQDIQDTGHYTIRKLANYFRNPSTLDIRPVVLHTNEESEYWATNFLSSFKKEAIIFQPYCSKKWHLTRSIPKEKLKRLLIELGHDYDVIDMTKPNLRNLSLSRYICLMRQCGRYVGCNTGDMHLAIAVGCNCLVFEPKSTVEFVSDHWKYNHPTIHYKNFDYEL